MGGFKLAKRFRFGNDASIGHGSTLNPWDPDITCVDHPGAGAAVAAGIGTIAHGNDIGGSSVRAALKRSADDLERSGYRVSKVGVPDIDGVWQTWSAVARTLSEKDDGEE